MLRVESVEPNSYAAELGLLAGDRLLSINSHEMTDLVDYHLCMGAKQLLLTVLRENDDLWELALEKDQHEDLGINIEHPQPRQCGNQCLFCFVHQLPKGMRKTLYIKDEDYRFSYLYGSYITLTNISEVDLQRIIRDKLSPLYISVHATDHLLRERLLGTEVPEILPLLQQLVNAGIELHCQVVFCPGINDGTALEQTIEDLASFYPQVASVAIVPVGLTRYRSNLPRLEKVTSKDAVSCLQLIHRYQDVFSLQHGTRFVFAADEFYLLAEKQIPPYAAYEEFPQIENGVGLIAQFRHQAAEVLQDVEELDLDKITLITGCLFRDELIKYAEQFSAKVGVELQVVAIGNDFFGPDITVTGLITGNDLLQQLQGLSLGDGLLIPDIMLKDGRQLFLDDVNIEKIKKSLQVPVVVVENSPWGILDGVESIVDNPVEIIQL
jgi:putative radical SAM enzyme (TIGR03279 family)